MKTYNVEDISKMLNVNKETVRRWIRNGRLKATQWSKKTGNVVTEKNLMQFINENPKYKNVEEKIMSRVNINEENKTLTTMYTYVDDLDIEIANDIWKIAQKSPKHGSALMDMLGAPVYCHVMNIKNMGKPKEEK